VFVQRDAVGLELGLDVRACRQVHDDLGPGHVPQRVVAHVAGPPPRPVHLVVSFEGAKERERKREGGARE
jgi:hypothetical protein